MAPVRARLPNARTLKQKAADPRVDRLVHEDGERGKTSAGGTGSDPRVAPPEPSRSTTRYPRLEQGVTRDNLSSNYFLSYQPGRKRSGSAQNEPDPPGTVREMAATTPAAPPHASPANLPIVRLSRA